VLLQEYRLRYLFTAYEYFIDHRLVTLGAQDLAPGASSNRIESPLTGGDIDPHNHGALAKIRRDLFETSLLGPKVVKGTTVASNLNEFVQKMLVLTTYEDPVPTPSIISIITIYGHNS